MQIQRLNELSQPVQRDITYLFDDKYSYTGYIDMHTYTYIYICMYIYIYIYINELSQPVQHDITYIFDDKYSYSGVYALNSCFIFMF
jgi:hypothetical protein